MLNLSRTWAKWKVKGVSAKGMHTSPPAKVLQKGELPVCRFVTRHRLQRELVAPDDHNIRIGLGKFLFSSQKNEMPTQLGIIFPLPV
jgi:hypothetical protein